MSDPAPTPRPKDFRWPWFVLAGVLLFFISSVLWLMVFVQRVKRIKASTEQMTNSTSAPAKQ